MCLQNCCHRPFVGALSELFKVFWLTTQGAGVGNGERIRRRAEVRVTVFCWLTYVDYVLHHWVSGRRGFQSAGHRDPQDDTNDGTCAHTCFICRYRLIPHTLLTFTLRFWLIERSGLLYWLYTVCLFKSTALSSALSYTVDVLVFSVALWGVGEVPPRQTFPGFVSRLERSKEKLQDSSSADLAVVSYKSAPGTRGKRLVLFS